MLLTLAAWIVMSLPAVIRAQRSRESHALANEVDIADGTFDTRTGAIDSSRTIDRNVSRPNVVCNRPGMSKIGRGATDAGKKLRRAGRQRQARYIRQRHPVHGNAARRRNNDGRRRAEHFERPVQRRDAVGRDLIDDGRCRPAIQVRVGAQRAAKQRRTRHGTVIEHQAARIDVERLVLPDADAVCIGAGDVDRGHTRAGLRDGRLE
nr:hypothetical protein [Burkholderia territorii]